MGVDCVGEGVHRLGIAGVPLHGHFNLVALALAEEIHHGAVDRLFGPVDVLDEVDQTAGVVEGAVLDLGLRGRTLGSLLLGGFRCLGGVADDLVDDLLGRHALIGEVDGQTLVEERHLLQAPGHRLEVVVGGLEDRRIGPVPDGGSGLLGGLTLFERAGHRIVVGLEPFVTITADVRLQPRRQRVHDRDADAV